MGLLRIKPYSKITVTELCRLADINRGTFYIHYFDVDDVLDDIVTESFSDVSQTIGHVLCPQKETCTYPFCQKVQENEALWPLFMDTLLKIDSISVKYCAISFFTAAIKSAKLIPTILITLQRDDGLPVRCCGVPMQRAAGRCKADRKRHPNYRPEQRSEAL